MDVFGGIYKSGTFTWVTALKKPYLCNKWKITRIFSDLEKFIKLQFLIVYSAVQQI